MIRWIIQKNLLAENDISEMIDACKKANVEYELVTVVPFSEKLPIFIMDDKINIYYGSTTLIENIYKEYRPDGIFFNGNFSMENYISKWGKYMLSSDAKITTLKEFSESDLQDNSQWFIRPDADDKSFAGEVMYFSDIKNWKNKLNQVDNIILNEDTKIIVSEPYHITREWRNYIVNGRIVTSSLYRKNFELCKSRTEIPGTMISFCEDRCKEYAPHDIFAMDIAECGGEYYIIECGCMNSVGFYACNIYSYIKEISNFMKNMKRVNDKNYFPVKGDTVKLWDGRILERGTVLDNDFNEIKWESGNTEFWSGLWETFVNSGGYVIKKDD